MEMDGNNSNCVKINSLIFRQIIFMNNTSSNDVIFSLGD